MRCLWGLLVFAAVILPSQIKAHEASLGVLQFREVRPGAFIGRWLAEPGIGANRVDLRVPPHCFLQMPEMNCGKKGLVGSISIPNLGSGLSAVLIKVLPIKGEPQSYTLSAANPSVSLLGGDAPTWQTWLELAKTYVNYGIDHILLGADHLLFVLGLIWIVRGGWKLVKTISSFTIGHSVSLALAAFGVIGLPEAPLNACIALSIVFVGVEIVKQQRGEIGLTARYPWAVAFAFGLVHGIGFAGALAGLGLERRLLPAALLFFNVGVEIGQVAFVLLVLALMWAHRRLNAVLPRWGDALPAYGIGSISMFWFFGRLVRVLVIT
ncbi:HupE/UreJ family protein [Bradyrhizobium sp. ISRA443]|uniref:HupE/UreJ family protein n=1 Tax=unclassified Bradyrhizobium TaxID=2631580 RepID=UPI00247A55D4|nr:MULTISPECIES: HupE/UreJ family protein [unclassified Bradyrhizobium]WGR93903.1 HupE/UreJ family protein [Bradyrhizobium sp. ISRA435]WGR98523.1 HupE/UreJ family protein [Bradyrhizobium sp. ISRA436]WGS05412.1 HupE/UreJ family protein [Bradyrhizobium sp. ISRA437]WGS12298.1 HupE/UreJ family protein [Bradyrhizobium sp. ISRA443]